MSMTRRQAATIIGLLAVLLVAIALLGGGDTGQAQDGSRPEGTRSPSAYLPLVAGNEVSGDVSGAVVASPSLPS